MDFHPRRVTRHNQRNCMIFIAWPHRMDGALMQVVRKYRPGSEHLCALDHDPIITFLNDATIQVRRVLLMRLLGYRHLLLAFGSPSRKSRTSQKFKSLKTVHALFYGQIDVGIGAHKIAKTITPMYTIFLFFDSGETSSSGFASLLLELRIKMNNAIIQ